MILFSAQTAVGLDTDCRNHTFYWSDVTGGKINKANMRGEEIETVISGEIDIMFFYH